jgi:D-3-phosphoglycerate dehydrogenase / 2-oxoglutarate reductase
VRSQPNPNGRRVLLDVPPFPVDTVAELLAGTGVTVEAPPRPWTGDDVIGVLVDRPLTEADFDRLPGLRVVASNSTGFDHIDIAAAARRQIWVCNVPEYCIDEVAESSTALLLALLRGIVVLDRSVQAGSWNDHAAGPLGTVAGTTLGIIGFGRIGRAVARRALALGFRVLATDPQLAPQAMRAAGVHPAGLDDLLRECTAVTLHAARSPGMPALIGRRELALMPRGAYLVNVARGPLVDLDALLEALESGQLAGAALDVLPVEPPTATDLIPRHPRLVVTPHAAWYSPNAEREVYRQATLAIRAVLEGAIPDGAVLTPSLAQPTVAFSPKNSP